MPNKAESAHQTRYPKHMLMPTQATPARQEVFKHMFMHTRQETPDKIPKAYAYAHTRTTNTHLTNKAPASTHH